MHVHSAAAKPRILRALPGVLSDARLASGADCATAEAAVRHHNLLCETFDEGSNAAAHHAAAVDVYLEHLESLAVPHASEHAKMAACRPLEQACLECGPRRFVAALGRWLYPRVLIRSASICTKSRAPRAEDTRATGESRLVRLDSSYSSPYGATLATFVVRVNLTRDNSILRQRSNSSVFTTGLLEDVSSVHLLLQDFLNGHYAAL